MRLALAVDDRSRGVLARLCNCLTLAAGLVRRDKTPMYGCLTVEAIWDQIRISRCCLIRYWLSACMAGAYTHI